MAGHQIKTHYTNNAGTASLCGMTAHKGTRNPENVTCRSCTAHKAFPHTPTINDTVKITIGAFKGKHAVIARKYKWRNAHQFDLAIQEGPHRGRIVEAYNENEFEVIK